MLINGLDVAIIIIIGLFILVGVLRGFLGEIFSFLTWVVSFLIAWFFSGDLTGWFAGQVKDANLRAVMVFFTLFFAVFIIMTITSHLVRTLWLKNGPQGSDRVLGGLIGFAKGSAVVVLMVLLAGFTPFPKDHFWHASLLVRYFQTVAMQVAHWLPTDVARNVRYS